MNHIVVLRIIYVIMEFSGVIWLESAVKLLKFKIQCAFSEAVVYVAVVLIFLCCVEVHVLCVCVVTCVLCMYSVCVVAMKYLQFQNGRWTAVVLRIIYVISEFCCVMCALSCVWGGGVGLSQSTVKLHKF